MLLVVGCAQVRSPLVTTAEQGATLARMDGTREATLLGATRDQLTRLVEAGADLWSVMPRQARAKGALTPAQAELARRLGIVVQWGPQRQALKQADPSYRNYDRVLNRLRELAALRPELATLVDVGDSWEKTRKAADRDLWALHLVKNPGKPVVVIAGCHHAREIVTPELVLRMAEHLVLNYGQDDAITQTLNDRDVWLIPLVNPDAYGRALAGADWRKNANNDTGGRRRVGVDLNRNYDIAWGTVGDSGNKEADTFRGSAPFSEPETQAMRDLLSRTRPIIYLTYHSYGNVVMWPWDHKDEPPADPRLARLGQQLGKLAGYDAYQGSKMYLNSGDDVDWAHAKLGTLAYTVEVGSWSDGFMPDASRLSAFWTANRPLMWHAIRAADNPGVTPVL
jgi:hypothetical protein